MTVPIDTTLCLAAGHAFAIAGADKIQKDPDKEVECLNRGRVYTAAVVVPVGAYFLIRWPDWSWAYTMKKGSRSKLLGALGLAGYLAAHEAGFRSAARSIREGRMDRALMGLAGSALLATLVTFGGFRRLHWLGTREEFESGTAKSIFRSPDFILSMLGAGAAAAPGAVYVIAKNFM